jgi:protein involved in polysaccharide export with SLBB domain
VDVSIWNTEPFTSYDLFISAEGRLLVPPAGALEVAGMTLAEAEEFLARELASYFSDEAGISLSLINPRIFRAYAAGAVLLPGTYAVSAVDRIGDLIRAAGGIKRGGSKRRVRLLSKEHDLLEEVDLMSSEATGRLSHNPRLLDGCIVEVPSIENYVILTGKFPNLSGFDTVRVKDWNLEQANEFTVEFLEGETLKDLLVLAGEPQMSDTSLVGEVFVSRAEWQDQHYIKLTEEMLDDKLEHGSHYQFPARNAWVFVTGSTNNYGRFIYQPGWTVQDYLGQAGGPNFNGSRRTIYLRRSDGTEFKCKPTEKVFPGDSIFVPEKFHLDRVLPILAGVASALVYVIAR